MPTNFYEQDTVDFDNNVHEAIIVLKVMGVTASDAKLADWIGSMSVEQIGQQMDEGDLLGTTLSVSCRHVAAGQVAWRSEAYGNDGSFFEGADAVRDDAPADAADRIAEAQAAAGLSDRALLTVMQTYLAEAGLLDDAAAFLDNAIAIGADAPGATDTTPSP